MGTPGLGLGTLCGDTVWGTLCGDTVLVRRLRGQGQS